MNPLVARGSLLGPAWASGLSILLGACGHDSVAPAPIATIEVTAPSDYLLAAGTLQLTATAQDAQGHVLADRNVAWTSSDASVLTVSPAGLVSGVARGTATVTASAEGVSNSVGLGVTVLALVRVTAPTFVLQPGTSTQPLAVVVDSAGHEIASPVTWSSSDGTVATVAGTGRVTAQASGVASISAAAVPVAGAMPIAVQTAITGKIAFISRRGPIHQAPQPTQQGGVYFMNDDGTQQQPVLQDPLLSCSPDPGFPDQCYIPWVRPALAADGLRFAAVRRVIYEPEFAGDMIFECSTSGTTCILVDYPAMPPQPAPVVALAGVADPAWSPDGGNIAFGAGRIRIWTSATGIVSDVPGTSALGGAQPAWSPDGRHLAFTGGQSTQDIWTADPDGSHLVNLTNGGGQNTQPAWSPDGARIAFVSNRDGDDEIYVMSADGSAPLNLTHNAASDEHPAWSPDSAKIAFQTNRDGNNEIYAMYADGSNPLDLTNDPADDTSPSWGP